jgi:hypothetical protein
MVGYAELSINFSKEKNMKNVLYMLGVLVVLSATPLMAAETAPSQSQAEVSAQDLNNVQTSNIDPAQGAETDVNALPPIRYYRCPRGYLRRSNFRGYCCIRVFHESTESGNNTDKNSSGQKCD